MVQEPADYRIAGTSSGYQKFDEICEGNREPLNIFASAAVTCRRAENEKKELAQDCRISVNKPKLHKKRWNDRTGIDQTGSDHSQQNGGH